jgi:hypothetical protein
MIPTRAILDANVLFDSYLQGLLLALALPETYVPLWTSAIFDAVKRALGHQ